MSAIHSMAFSLPGWSGSFDCDFTYSPGSYPTYWDPGDPPECEVRVITWHFSPNNSVEVECKAIGDALYEALCDHICANYGYEEDGYID